MADGTGLHCYSHPSSLQKYTHFQKIATAFFLFAAKRCEVKSIKEESDEFYKDDSHYAYQPITDPKPKGDQVRNTIVALSILL